MFSDSFSNSAGGKDFINQRSFEIAWAVFRCASLISQPKLKTELENKAIELVALAGQNAPLEVLDSLIGLAEAVGEIRPINARVLFREIAGLKKAIQQREAIIRQEAERNSAISDIFVALPPAGKASVASNIFYPARKEERNSSKRGNFGHLGNNPADNSADVDNPAKAGDNSARGSNNSANNPANPLAGGAEVRQELILKKLKQRGSASTKDLITDFPFLSERTIRAYLQRLCEAGLLERVGTSGPGSFYRAK